MCLTADYTLSYYPWINKDSRGTTSLRKGVSCSKGPKMGPKRWSKTQLHLLLWFLTLIPVIWTVSRVQSPWCVRKQWRQALQLAHCPPACSWLAMCEIYAWRKAALLEKGSVQLLVINHSTSQHRQIEIKTNIVTDAYVWNRSGKNCYRGHFHDCPAKQSLMIK